MTGQVLQAVKTRNAVEQEDTDLEEIHFRAASAGGERLQRSRHLTQTWLKRYARASISRSPLCIVYYSVTHITGMVFSYYANSRVASQRILAPGLRYALLVALCWSLLANMLSAVVLLGREDARTPGFAKGELMSTSNATIDITFGRPQCPTNPSTAGSSGRRTRRPNAAAKRDGMGLLVQQRPWLCTYGTRRIVGRLYGTHYGLVSTRSLSPS
jgi:hypothetical protein